MSVNALAYADNTSGTGTGATDSNAGSKDQNLDHDLTQLERRYFEHPYKNDTTTERLSRLEEFVFGSVQSGSDGERLARLLTAIPAQNTNNSNSTNSTTGQSAPAAGTSTNESTSTNTSSEASSTSPQSSVTGYPFDYTSYPRVNKLEQELFGQTFTDDTLSQRLTRLEDKAFGKPSDSNDMSQRVEALEEYADRNDLYGTNTATAPGTIVPFSPSATQPYANSQSYAAGQSYSGTQQSIDNQPYSSNQSTTTNENTTTTPFVGSAPELVAMMESQVFDHTYPDRPLMARVKKLEKQVLNGKENTKADLNTRVATLWDKLHPSQPAQVQSLQTNSYSQQSVGANGNQTYTSNNGSHHSWLHKLATGVGAVAGGLARGMMYSGMGGYGMGGYGMGGYGMGYGMGGYGMGYGMGSPFGFW